LLRWNGSTPQLHQSLHVIDDIGHADFGSGPVDADGSDEQSHWNTHLGSVDKLHLEHGRRQNDLLLGEKRKRYGCIGEAFQRQSKSF